VPYASGKLDLGGESNWVEYVRGKDLAAFLKERPGRMLSFVGTQRPGHGAEDQVAEFCELLVRRQLLVKAERKFKKPKPGRKQLVKWPRSLELCREPGFSEAAFYAWAYDRPTSPWSHVLSALLVVLTVGCCLFPLAPHRVRIWVVYGLLGLLSLLLGIMLLRYVLAFFAWALTGGELWLFPNMTSDNVPITEAFWPVVTYSRADRQTAAHWTARATALALVSGLVYVLYSFSPGALELRDNARRAHDSITRLLQKHSEQQMHLAAEPEAGPGGEAGGADPGGEEAHGGAAGWEGGAAAAGGAAGGEDAAAEGRAEL
jgi:translocation protein SEC62